VANLWFSGEVKAKPGAENDMHPPYAPYYAPTSLNIYFLEEFSGLQRAFRFSAHRVLLDAKVLRVWKS